MKSGGSAPDAGRETATRPIRHCYWVEPGRLLAGEYPRELDEEASREKVRALTGAGVTHFIDLTEEGETFLTLLEPYAHLAAPAKHLRFPIRDMTTPASPEVAAAALDAIDEAIAGGGTAYVHCLGGIGRTGTIVGCWLVRHGRGGEEALVHLAELWRQNPKSRIWADTPQTEEQRDYIRRWREKPGP